MGHHLPDRVCDVCAGLLGLTSYDPRLDGPHAQIDAYDAVRLLIGAEPLTAAAAAGAAGGAPGRGQAAGA